MDCKELKRYETIFDNRKSEIDRFWHRSLFFWGFIAASFVAFADLYDKDRILSLAIAFFGFVCSFFWYLINRGSKFWQVYWEGEIEKVEGGITGPLFKPNPPVEDRNKWYNPFAPARFSVSKVTISLSLYTSLIWLVIIIYCLVKLPQEVVVIGFICLTIFWIIWTFRSSLKDH